MIRSGLSRFFPVLLAATLAVMLFSAPSLLGQTYQWTNFAGQPGVVGSADGTGNSARFDAPTGVAVDGSGNLIVADRLNDTIRKITPAGVVTTIAGRAGVSGSFDGGPNESEFSQPCGVALDSNGNIYVADYNNDTIRKIGTDGLVSTIAGMPGQAGSVDGTGISARFKNPSGVAVDANSNVYVADYGNHTIRKITPAGVVTTLAGSAGNAGAVNGAGTSARFNGPFGIAVASTGNVIYVADEFNDAIRQVTSAGVVTTFCGVLATPGSSDGSPTLAHFNGPRGLALDGAGNIYVADQNNDTIRRVSSAGAVVTIGGLAGQTGTTGGIGLLARFHSPQGVAALSNGTVLLGDTGNARISQGTGAASCAITGVTGVSYTSATLSGTVNPGGLNATTAWFDYAPTPSFGSSTAHQFLGSGSSPAAVQATLNGLSVGTTYYYRVTANNAVGTSYSSTGTFTTLSAPQIAIYSGFTTSGQPLSNGQASPVNFGGTPLGVPATQTFTILNQGNIDLHITGITMPAGYTFAGTFTPVTLRPGFTYAFGVNFLANSVTGTFTGTCSIASDDPINGTYSLNFTASAGDPVTGDSGFNGSGSVTTYWGQYSAVVWGMALQRDGRIVVAASLSTGTFPNYSYSIGVLRYNADGTLDATFGGTGMVVTNIGNDMDSASAMALQNDGKILVVGASGGANGPTAVALVRYNTDGSLDTTFNGTGKVKTPIGSSWDSGEGLALQSDGRIVVAGYTTGANNADFAVLRYNTNGTLDTTFGGTGIVTTDFGGTNDYGRGVVIQGDGKIVVGGTSNNAFALARYNTNGTLDTSFAGSGYEAVSIAGNDTCEDMALQPDGKFVLTGSSYNSSQGTHSAELARFNPDGTLDTSFNGNGKALYTDQYGYDEGHRVTLQPDGKILMGGSNSYGNILLARYTTNGTLDSTFNGTGLLTSGLTNGAYGMALQSDGKIDVAGTAISGGVTVVRFGIGLQPTVATAPASGVDSSSATLNGTVNANGVLTSAWFQYGLDTNYGQSTSPQALGYGTSGQTVSAISAPLSQGTLYHYRLVAQNGETTIYGADFTLTTLSPSTWRQFYFGTTSNTGIAADNADADGTGQSNLFKYVAGLSPVDPNARFYVNVAAVAGQPAEMEIMFGPIESGRSYTVTYKSSLTDPAWTPLTNFTTNINGSQCTVTDLSVGPTPRFYHVEISIP